MNNYTAENISNSAVAQGDHAQANSAQTKDSPTVGVVYSRDNKDHINWVTEFVFKLRSLPITVAYDGDFLLGNLKDDDMKALLSNDYVLIVCTEEYKRKTESAEESGVRFEWEHIEKDLESNPKNSKYIPILRSGNKDVSIPQRLSKHWHADLVKDIDFRSEGYIKVVNCVLQKRATGFDTKNTETVSLNPLGEDSMTWQPSAYEMLRVGDVFQLSEGINITYDGWIIGAFNRISGSLDTNAIQFTVENRTNEPIMGMTMHVLRQDIIDENRYWTILTLRSIVGSNFRGIILPGDTVFVEDELYRHDEYAKTNGRYLIQLRARIDNGELKSGFYYILGRDEAQSI